MFAEMTAEDLQTHARELDARANELCDEAERCRAQARAARVEAAKRRNGHEVKVAPSLEVQLRDFAMKRDTFTEEEFLEHAAVTKARFRALAAKCTEAGQLAGFKMGKHHHYAWVKPDHDSSAPERKEHHATPVTMMPRRRGDSTVAGTGKRKLSGRKEVNRLVKAAKKQGAEVEMQGNGHIRVTTDKGSATMAKSPRGNGMGRTKREFDELGLTA